ncbi:NgoPII family restriction endonuclease [Staphylococcus schleiferi subsp. coagulans]|uniref:NgoPII family restriction endonuclease n=1 Tax=Staphylococcus coagulans TaxID=74706 RepID=UPI0015F82DA8|nr:NgoPII family restriction endonuclease [Staphylococcus coagulans]MBA8779886.1 NgoPII family restriction endonuclease [Staphylococcus coagulans]
MNIIDAIINLIQNPIYELKATYVNAHNRVNSVGDALEEYIKDLFSDAVNETNHERRIVKYNEVFSYLGNNSNPPDIMLKGGDAIEVKKIESLKSSLALNSSYPKHKLLSTNPLINKACRECEYIPGTKEFWKEKDMIYTIGTIDKNNRNLKNLIFIYGEDYAADIEIYEKVKLRIKEGVSLIENVEFTPTKELGKVKKIDPLGLTDLRIRGMWHIINPINAFSDIIKYDAKKKFNFTAIINTNKWNSFDNTGKLVDVINNNKNAKLIESKIQDSNNPAKLKDVKVIVFSI